MNKMIWAATLLASVAVPLTSASAATTLVNFSLNDGVVALANGSFSYDSATTGQLTYSDLQSFSLNLPTNSFDLAFVNSGNDSTYKYFGFNATTKQFVSANISGFPEILSDIKSNFASGFFVRQDPAYTIFSDYAAGNSPVPFTNITINSSTIGAVPEPATWAMMLAGFGMIGFAARRRQLVKSTVSFA